LPHWNDVEPARQLLGYSGDQLDIGLAEISNGETKPAGYGAENVLVARLLPLNQHLPERHVWPGFLPQILNGSSRQKSLN
jgi:hypothetical protein